MRPMQRIWMTAAGLVVGVWIGLAGACGVIDAGCSSGSNCVCKGTGLCAGGGCKLSCSGTGACTLTACTENCDVACSVGKCESSCTDPSCTKL